MFLCGQCNMKCLRKVNGSKIKSKMPIERFLAQRDSEDLSDSFAVDALDLPLPPPTAAEFPELPRAAPTPKMTKAEKAMAQKINALLLSDAKGKHVSETPSKPVPVTNAPPTAVKTPSNPAPGKLPTTSPATLPPPPPSMAQKGPPDGGTPGIIRIPRELVATPPIPSPTPSGVATPIIAMAVLHAEHAVSCQHCTDQCGACWFGITCCQCHVMYTAPAAKRMRCTTCLHWACDLDQSNECCMCGTLWVPVALVQSDPVGAKPATRFRGGAGSDKEWSDDSSVHTAQEDSTVKIKIAAPTQESIFFFFFLSERSVFAIYYKHTQNANMERIASRCVSGRGR